MSIYKFIYLWKYNELHRPRPKRIKVISMHISIKGSNNCPVFLSLLDLYMLLLILSMGNRSQVLINQKSFMPPGFSTQKHPESWTLLAISLPEQSLEKSESLNRTQPTTLLQIICELMIIYKVFFWYHRPRRNLLR